MEPAGSLGAGALLRGQRLISDPRHLGFVHDHRADHGQSGEDTAGDEHQVEVEDCRKDRLAQKVTPNTASMTQTSAVLTRAHAAVRGPPQTKRTLGNKVPRALGNGLPLPTSQAPAGVGVDASTRAPGAGVPCFAHHDLTADVDLGGESNTGQTCSVKITVESLTDPPPCGPVTEL